MPLNRSAKIFASRAPRRLTTPRCRGGASSVLRLAQPAVPRLPSALDLSDWLAQAAGELLPVTGPLAALDMHADASGAR